MIREKFIEGVEQSVRQGVLAATWPRFPEKYEEERYNDGEVWATAPLPGFWREANWAGLSEEQRKRALESDPTASGQGRLYSPLTDTPDLFIRFARLEPTEEAWRSFLHRYGALGPDPRRDRFSRFVEEVRRAKRVLKLYEAATAKPANVKAVADIFGEDGGLENSEKWSKENAPPQASLAALKEVDTVMKEMLKAETFADYHDVSHGEQPLPSWGFHSLLGCIWLEFFFARTSIREPRKCAAEDCSNALTAGGKGEKALYGNKRYCSKACGERQRDHDRKWSRTLSRSPGAGET